MSTKTDPRKIEVRCKLLEKWVQKQLNNIEDKAAAWQKPSH